MKFHKEQAAHAAKFEVILMHNKYKGAMDFAKLDKSMANKKKRNQKGDMVPLEEFWGEKLPFTLMLDTKGSTVKTWGIGAYPTTVLINPEGKLVATTEVDAKKMLSEALAAAANKPEGTPAKEPAKTPSKD